MKLLKSAVAVATVVACTSAFAGNDLGGVSATNDYLIGGIAVKPGFGSNFLDWVTFSLASSATVTGYATGATAANFATDLGGVYLYRDGTPNELGFATSASAGFDFGVLGPGSYGLAFAGVAANPGKRGYYSGVLSVSAVPEPETVAMMLAGIGAVGFMARRRRSV